MQIIRRFCGALAIVALTHATVAAQGFDSEKIRVGQTVLVLDLAGAQTKGVVQNVERSKLVVKYGAGRFPDPTDPGKMLNDTRMFTPADVDRIQLPAPVWDGAVKGALVGLIPLAVVAAVCDCGAPPAGAYVMFMGIGAGVGLGIDAAWGPKTIYRRTSVPRTLTVAPIAGRGRRGIAASIRF